MPRSRGRQIDALEARTHDRDDLERGQGFHLMALQSERAVGLHGADALALAREKSRVLLAIRPVVDRVALGKVIDHVAIHVEHDCDFDFPVRH